MPNSYPRNGIFNPQLTTIKDSDLSVCAFLYLKPSVADDYVVVFLVFFFFFFFLPFEPSHEVIALFVLRKLILQTRMRSHPVGLGV